MGLIYTQSANPCLVCLGANSVVAYAILTNSDGWEPIVCGGTGSMIEFDPLQLREKVNLFFPPAAPMPPPNPTPAHFAANSSQNLHLDAPAESGEEIVPASTTAS